MLIKKERVRERGFTLLEVLIAISVFSIGILAVAAMQGSATRGNRLGNELTQATVLAQDKIEELKSSPDIANEPDGNDQQGIFNRSWIINLNTNFSRIVRVTVSWTIGGNTYDVVLSTVTRGGGN